MPPDGLRTTRHTPSIHRVEDNPALLPHPTSHIQHPTSHISESHIHHLTSSIASDNDDPALPKIGVIGHGNNSVAARPHADQRPCSKIRQRICLCGFPV